MVTLKQLKMLDNSDKSLVFGFIKMMEKKSNLIAIPLLVFYNILGYYYIHDYFEKCGDDLQISEDKMTITKITKHRDWNDNNAYGKLWFKSNGNEIATWKFRMNKTLGVNREIYLSLVTLLAQLY